VPTTPARPSLLTAATALAAGALATLSLLAPTVAPTAAATGSAPARLVPAAVQTAAPTSNVWRYGRAYPNGLPAARTNTQAYSAPGVMAVGGGTIWVATGTPDGWVRVRDAATGGTIRDLYTGPGGVQASPAIVDWDRDGRPDIVAANLNGDLVVWNTDGRELLRRNVYTDNLPTHARGIFATPAVADLDGDGWAEMVVSSWDHHLYVLDHTGAVRKAIFVKDTMWASPAVVDVDHDGVPEIVAAWDCDADSNQFDCAYGRPGGFVGLFTRDLVPVWKQFLPGQAAWSSPVVGDLRGDGRLAVVLATGQMPCMMYTGAPGPCGTGSAVDTRSTGRALYGFDALTGAVLPGWPAALPEKTMSSPALADVDGDGRLEAFVATGGRLYRINSDGQAAWGADTCIALQKSPCGYTPLPKIDASPVVGDLLGGGRQVVAVGYDFKVTFVDAVTGAIVTSAEPARQSGEISTGIGNGLTATTWNGRTHVLSAIMLCRSDCYGGAPVWDAATVDVDSGPAAGSLLWPTFRGRMSRTGSIDAQPTGAIGGYWRDHGGAGGSFGAPLGPEYAVPGGRAQDFAGGRLYWSATTGTHSVIGAILGSYLGLGGPGYLGLPTDDEAVAGVPGARMSAFQRARIYWSASTGAHATYGAIAGRWQQTGGPAGPLGLPVGDETDGGAPGARMSLFQFGRVYWSGGTGAQELYGAILGHYLELGGPARFGLPTRGEYAREGARAADFQGMRVYWTPSLGATSVQGGIWRTYDMEGGAGTYGLPTGDERAAAAPGSAVSTFVDGDILYSPATAAHGVVGAARTLWRQLGAEAGLGFPTASQHDGDVAGSLVTTFERGEIDASPATGTHEIYGAILGRWRELGGQRSVLGLPTTGEYDVAAGRRHDFVGGTLTWDRTTGQVTLARG